MFKSDNLFVGTFQYSHFLKYMYLHFTSYMHIYSQVLYLIFQYSKLGNARVWKILRKKMTPCGIFKS